MGSERLFGEELPADLLQVIQSSSLLDVSEYRVFELAFERWHGEAAPEETIDRRFSLYLRRQEVPHWVRHFTRELLREAAAERLDPQSFGVAAAPGGWAVRLRDRWRLLHRLVRS